MTFTYVSSGRGTPDVPTFSNFENDALQFSVEPVVRECEVRVLPTPRFAPTWSIDCYRAPVRTHFTDTKFTPFRTRLFWGSSASYTATDQWVQDLLEISGLEDDWDAEGALAPKRETLAAATSVVLVSLDSLPAPIITANENGTITLEWRAIHGYASLEIGATKYAFMMRFDGDKKRFRNGMNFEIDGSLGVEIADAIVRPTVSHTAGSAFWMLGDVG